MAPWDGPEAFKNGKPFSGGADDYLRLLVEEILPKAEKQLSSPPALRGIMGYSLAGLFGLYTIYQTDEFSWRGMSGSLWIQGIYFLPQSQASAGLHVFLPGEQGGQAPLFLLDVPQEVV